MHIVWGCLTAAIGLAMFVGGCLKSEFILYRLLVARSKTVVGKARPQVLPGCWNHGSRFRNLVGLGSHPDEIEGHRTSNWRVFARTARNSQLSRYPTDWLPGQSE